MQLKKTVWLIGVPVHPSSSSLAGFFAHVEPDRVTMSPTISANFVGLNQHNLRCSPLTSLSVRRWRARSPGTGKLLSGGRAGPSYSTFLIESSPTCLIFHPVAAFEYSTRASAEYLPPAFVACNCSAMVYTRFCESSVFF